MLKVNKSLEPDFLKAFKRKATPRTWDDYNDGEIKLRIKQHILDNEQKQYCVYCENRIYEYNGCHIEHIKSRDMFPQLFQDYDNLMVSCDSKASCGKWKKNKYSEEFINPVLENPEEYLTYNLASGEIIPIVAEKEDIRNKKALYTIEILNLNNYKLTEARKSVIDNLLEVYRENYVEYKAELQYFIDDGYMFPSLIRLYKDFSL